MRPLLPPLLLVLCALPLWAACSELQEAPEPPDLADQFLRLEAPTGRLTAASVDRFAGRVEVAEAAYSMIRTRFVSATDALSEWDSDERSELDNAYGWFTITEPCELGGQFTLTGQFIGGLIEPTLWGEVVGCGYSGVVGSVWIDAEFLVNVAIEGTLEELATSNSEVAIRGSLRSGARTIPFGVVYAARLADANTFRAALRASGGDVHYERTEPGPIVLVQDLEDFWSCDLIGRRCDSDPLKSLSW